eukprot:6272592-Alexandrium_andersonii.AAC.1
MPSGAGSIQAHAALLAWTVLKSVGYPGRALPTGDLKAHRGGARWLRPPEQDQSGTSKGGTPGQAFETPTSAASRAIAWS